MPKHRNVAQPYHRFGFRDGWLYFRDQKGFCRLRCLPQVGAEQFHPSTGWNRIDVAMRDKVVNRLGNGQRPPTEAIEGLSLIPRGNAFEETDSGQLCMPWTLARPERRFVYSIFHWRQLSATLPGSLAKHVARLRCDLFSAVELLQQAPAALDLTRYNPVLATALARHWEFPAVGRVDWDAVRQQLRNRRRDILHWLGYPASECTINALERVAIAGKDAAPAIQRSLAVLNGPFFEPALKHVELIDEGVIDCLANPLTCQWLDPRRLKQTGSQLRRYVGFLFEPINILLTAGVIDLEVARRLSWGHPDPQTTKWMLPYFKARALPEAPVPTSPGITRMETLAEQIREGEVMHQCLGSMPYVLRAACGNVALYRVTTPVRATLALASQDKGRWRFEGLKGPHNADIARECIDQIAHAFPSEVEFEQWTHDRLGDAA